MNVALRPDSLNLISLCTGGAGLDLGIELAMPNARSVVLVEREAFAVSHLVAAMQQGLLAQAPLWSDVTTFNGRPWRGLVDGLIGGIPCQPHSLAGKRLGEDDERDLWSDARRIIVQSGAWFVLIENVRGMLSAKPGLDPGAMRVWRDLRRMGFVVEGGLFTASEVRASHERERIFILGVADGSGDGFGERGECDGVSLAWQHPSFGDDIDGRREALAAAGGARLPIGRRQTGSEQWADADGCHPAMGNTLRAGSHAGAHGGLHLQEEGRRPRHEDIAGSGLAVVDTLGGRHDGRSDDEVRRPLERVAVEGPSGIPLFPPGPSDLSGWRSVLERAPELEPAFRRVADGLASRLDIARVDRLRMLGNGVVPLEAAYAFRTLAARLAARTDSAARLVRMMRATP